MRVAIGPVAAVPDDACVAIGNGVAVAVRVGDEVCAYRNRCLHQDAPLAGGIVRRGVLSCPLHFWRYRARTGELVGARQSLERFPVEVEGGMAYVLLPDAPPPLSLREQLLRRARAYDRDEQFASERSQRGIEHDM